MLLHPRNPLLLLLVLPTLATPHLLTQSDTPTSTSTVILLTLLAILFLLTLLYCYDKRQNFYWLTSLRHSIGECIRRVRVYRRRSMDKSMRIQTEEVLPTPKTTHIEPENQRPFIESEPSVREPISPSDPIGHEQLQERKEVDLKNVFQQKEHKGGLKGKAKPKKEKKSKSKLKSRLQSTAGNEEEKEGQGQEEENSFSQEVEVGIGNGVEEVAARGSQVQ